MGSTESRQEYSEAGIDGASITGQFRALEALDGMRVKEALDLPDDRRNREDRRRTRNPVFEARARRVGLALDRRRRRGVLALWRNRARAVLRSFCAPRSARPGEQL